tara:strand:- start:101 stop:445 length:345 start_codon:yes stop_codon:yes gene_type:complete
VVKSRLSWLRRTQATPLGLATLIAGTCQQVFNPTMAGRATFPGTTASGHFMHCLSIADSNALLDFFWRHFQTVAEKFSTGSNLRNGDCRGSFKLALGNGRHFALYPGISRIRCD